MEHKQTFSFGRNWQTFLEGFDDERVKIAEASLTDFLGMPDLRGKSFLVGWAAALSYAASTWSEEDHQFRPGPFSVECCKYLRTRVNNPAHWEVCEGSVLDRGFLSGLGSFDIVYSWGVLHHTGHMWDAIEQSAALVNPGGHYYIAIYNKILARNGSTSWIHPFWLKVKTIYNTYPALGTYILEPLAMTAYLAIVVARGENPIAHIRNYKSHRGMSWRTDATDWLGGYPYEFATVEEVFKFIKGKFPDFNLVNVKVTNLAED
jgi:2-polyprenyl-6-hydroxyphenyl methylase/3-demethylubiquinone-9 3-methyltransferase